MNLYDLMGRGQLFLESFDFLFLGMIQFIVYLLFKKFPPAEERLMRFGKVQFRALSKPQLIIFYLALMLCCWYLNERYQVFCNLVFSANIMLWICLSAILIDAYFEVKNKLWSALLLFFQGIGIVIFLYLLIFWGELFLLGGIVFTISSLLPFYLGFIIFYFFILKKSNTSRLPVIIVLLTIYAPFLLLFQILENTLRANINNRMMLLLGFSIALIVPNITLSKYKSFLTEINQLSTKELTELEPQTLSNLDHYFLERTIGAHLIYHTRLCVVDGWRPPLHDPLFVYCYRITENDNPFQQANFSLYKKVFPNNPIRMNCACGKPGSEVYFNDKRLE